ncbi:MAG TPA: DUF2341 domain-containing protein [Pseudomonadales bacterium]|nr:DUF2341 domain-containing protein [Pseudomonadales bacterium]
MKAAKLLALGLAVAPAISQAWWNDEWEFRKKISVEVSADGHEEQTLLRLHTGNFAYFMDTKADGSDIRFVSEDDKTPLNYYVEKYDQATQMAFVWVKLPEGAGKADAQGKPAKTFYMYYGNKNAPAGQPAASIYNVNDLVAYSFADAGPGVQDNTAYGNHSLSTIDKSNASVIGGGAKLNGTQSIALPSSPNLAVDQTTGWTVSLWVKPEGMQSEAVLYSRGAPNQDVTLGIRGNAPFLRIRVNGVANETQQLASLNIDQWSQVAVTASPSHLTLFVNGQQVASLNANLANLSADARFGGNYTGEMDEIRVSKVAHTAAEIAGIYAQEAPDANLIALGDDEQRDKSGGESYFMTTMHNVTVDGWVVIGILGVMAVISWLVMLAKARMISRMQDQNEDFLEEYYENGEGDLNALQKKLNFDEVKHSPLFQVFNVGVREVDNRMGKALSAQASALPAKSIAAIKAALDAEQVRQNQKLNKLMVLLTIAISGGPFLGLLGTVVGVMITFAAIAASGDVNVNSIAPGIAAALVATVAGLAVAIPALFGYNYLGSRVKEINADMHVFSDELIGKIAEQYGE